MRVGRVIQAARLSCLPDQDAGSQPVVQVLTDLPAGQPNAFYMDTVDLDGQPIVLPIANQPEDAPIDPAALNDGDTVMFDAPDRLLHRVVVWKSRRVRQRGYSFDWLADQPNFARR